MIIYCKLVCSQDNCANILYVLGYQKSVFSVKKKSQNDILSVKFQNVYTFRLIVFVFIDTSGRQNAPREFKEKNLIEFESQTLWKF